MEPKTPEEFLNWVANWVLDGDPMPEDNPPEDQYEYELDNDEVYENYTTIVATARRLAGKDN
jgi:hypothetical protein